MNAATAARLIALNKQFYQTFGREFSSTRQRLQPGVLKVLDMLTGGEFILDIGCGNGEMARELMRRGQRGAYTGVDFSLSLLKVARLGWEDAPATFLRADLTSADWDKKIIGCMPRPFDLVTAFATLHHIPDAKARLRILNKIHALLRPGGRFIHSEWQFLNSEKLKGRIQAWADAGLKAEDVDAGDYLIDWRGGGRGLRYVHHFDEVELETLAEASRFRVRSTFWSDGDNGRLGLYQVWDKL
jgi:tRNA (uracil-5-)-methyltransferase TRM9